MTIAILGLGKTGQALARYFYQQGEKVWGIDDREELPAPIEQHCFAQLFLGRALPPMKEVKRFFISPGVDPRHVVARAASERGLPLEGELDLAFSLCRGRVIAITGTNGKSTTVSLLGAIYQAANISVAVGGNLGTPFIDQVTEKFPAEVFVVETSSYQLETIRSFKPKIAALLNISEDHLDRYENLTAYAQAKARIFAVQNAEDSAVYNDDDLQVLKSVEKITARKIPFSLSKQVQGAYPKNQKIIWAPQGKVVSEFDLTQCKLKGLHNLENISAAVACAKCDEVPDHAIQKALDTFEGLPHRVQWVADVGGVEFYDDSKGTNVGAVVMSLAGFENNVVLILGGRDKGGDYSSLKPLIKHKAKGLVVIGEAKEKILSSLGNLVSTVTANSMEEAVREAYRLAQPNGTVLLSPACSSFDMFRDYHDRGEQFKNCVQKLKSTS